MATTLDSSFLYTEEYLRDPTPYWSRLRHDAPLLFDEQGEFWLLSRYHDVVSVLLDFETYSTLPYRRIFRPVIGPTFVEMDGQDHDSRRAIVAPALVGNALGSYRPLVEQSVAKIAATLPGGSSCDLRAAFTSRLPLLVIAELLGLAEEDHELFYRHCGEILHGLEGREPALSPRNRLAPGACRPFPAAGRRAPDLSAVGSDLADRRLGDRRRAPHRHGDRIGDQPAADRRWGRPRTWRLPISGGACSPSRTRWQRFGRPGAARQCVQRVDEA